MMSRQGTQPKEERRVGAEVGKGEQVTLTVGLNPM